MAGLTTIFAFVRPDESAKACSESFRYLLNHSPLLANLALYRDTTESFPHADWWVSLASIFPLRPNVSSPLALRSLELAYLDLDGSSHALLKELNMSRLEDLDIRDCIGRWIHMAFRVIKLLTACLPLEVNPLLLTFTSLFSRVGSNLQVLHLESEEPLYYLGALESFLQTW